MIENKQIMVLLSLVVVASGCAHTAGGTSSDTATASSVSVQNFTSPAQVYGDQPTRLTLTLINNGDATAENVVARIFNVPFVRNSGNNNNAWQLDGSRTVSFGNLQPADEENSIPARPRNEYWTLTSPNLDNGVTIPYQFMTKISYKYSTRGTSSITLMDQQRFREQGNPSRPTLDLTSGPIQMEIRTRSPIVFYPEDEGQRTTEMCVVVRNQGQGTPFLHNKAFNGDTYEVTKESSNKVKLRVPDQGGIDFVPQNPSGGSSSNTAVVEIFGNRGIECFKINVDNWEQGLGPQQEVPIVLEAIYGYQKESATSVTVEGNERF